jgi:poly(glycerol-phosphate) alpha-glucosyltransferase
MDSEIWCLDTPEDVRWALDNVELPPEAVRAFPRVGPGFLGYSRDLAVALTGPEGARIDVIHQHGIWTGISPAANGWRRAHGGPTVLAPHGALEAWALKRSAWKKWLASLAYENENLQNAACMHATSLPEMEGFVRYGVDRPIALIPNGFPEGWISTDNGAERFRTQFGVADDMRIMLYVGRVTPVKNLVAFLEAMAMQREKLARWVLFVVGKDEFGYLKAFEQTVDRLDLTSHVRAVGFLDDPELKRDAFAAASFFVLPSIREASPIVVLEALGAGIPVLTTEGAPWPELETQKCGWWCGVDADSLSRSLCRALQASPAELRSMGARGRELVRGRYTWSAIATDTRAVYSWLLDGGRRPERVFLPNAGSWSSGVLSS